MMRLCLLSLALSAGFIVNAQTLEIIEPKDNQEMNKMEVVNAKKRARVEAMAADGVLPKVYVAIDLIRFPEQKSLDVRIEKGDYILGSLLEGMPTPELDQLTKRSLAIRSEIDILNFLSERGWELVMMLPAEAVEPKTPEKGMRTRMLLRKTFSHEP